ncbi:MAG: glycoside hydrolase family 16 protein [Planctomycetes bacterium]|nr:glycoside hydrolase family 16 protein [Planctomycetota bacterium]
MLRNHHLFAFALAVFQSVSAAELKPASADADKWEPVWADEFDGAQIDKEKWKFVIGGGGYGNNELQYYSDRAENAFIEDGHLVIQARQEKLEKNNYTSAKLQSKAAWTNGRYEFRAKMPLGKGIWPAIWMMPSDMKKYGGWPACGEIDILELLGQDPTRVYGTLHFGNPHKSSGKSVVLKKGTFSEDWHEFVLEWYPGEMRYLIDGELYQIKNDWFTNAADAKWPAPFDRDFYIQLNLAVGGQWPGAPDAKTTFPQKLLIDYVRVYKSKTPQPERAKGSVDEKLPPLQKIELKK